jgi:hypothetical protein
MQFDELERYLAVAMGHSVTVDVRRCPGIPGVVRTTTVHRGNRVTIEHEVASIYASGEPEGFGPKYVGEYDTLGELVERLERFFDRRISAWRNHSMEPFGEDEIEDGFDHVAAQRRFEDLVRARAIELPVGGDFRIADIHYRHIAKYGEYRDDKVFEEENEFLEQLYGPD